MSETQGWNDDITPKMALEIQRKLRDKVTIRSVGKPIKSIAGADM